MAQHLPEDVRAAVERHLREYDRLSEDLRVVERELAREALADADAKRLMTIPGVDMVVAVVARERACRRWTTARETPRLPPSQGWLPCLGTGGWLASDSLAGLRRPGCFPSEYAA